MNLDSNLLKEFAKITNDSEVKSENKYLRGTIVSNSGGKYVQIDGSTTVTPISELVDVKEGDRVLVSIENHKATIVGNYSFPPSARKEQEALDKANEAKETADGVSGVANTAQQKAQEASNKADEAISQSSIASSSANEAKQQATEAINKANDAQGNIQEAKNLATQASTDATEAKNQAAASQASSAEAQAKVTELQNEVKGAKEDIDKALEDLEAQGEEITVFKETYSTKVETNKVKADLSTEIDVKVGSLQTTIEENYSTKTENVALEGRLQTQITQNAEGFASQASKIEKLEGDTAEAQKDVENALAQAAAAQSSAADAQSKANAAQAAANTATADAQEAANKAQLAQNAADAATAAANAADKAVQDAQGDLNEAKQNLANVTSRVDATEADIAEAQAKVDAAQQEVNEALADAAEARQVADNATEAANKAQQDAETAQGVANTAKQKADNAKTAADNAQAAADKAQADVAALTSRVTTAETKITQNTEQISLNASKTEEIGTKVDNIKVGGRNYLLNTNQGKTKWSINKKDGVTTIEDYLDTDNIKGIKITCETTSSNWYVVQYNIGTTQLSLLKQNTPYVLSFDILSNIGNTNIQFSIRQGDGKNVMTTDNICTIKGDETLEKVVIPVKTITDFSTIAISNQVVYITGVNKVGYAIIKNLKLEEGTIPTTWTPAPEDVESDINGVKTDLVNNYYTKTQTDAQIKVQSDRITSTVSRVETVEKTASDAKTSIDNLQVGGTNILRASDFKDTTTAKSKWSVDGATITYGSDDPIYGTYLKAVFNKAARIYYSTSKVWEAGKVYAVSFMAKTDTEGTTIRPSRSIVDYAPTLALTSEWQRYEGLINCTETADTGTLSLSVNKVCTIYITDIKLEKGNKVTSWSPAPEDIDKSINNAQTSANNAQTAANNAQTAADNAQADIDGLVVSGRNLVLNTSGEWSDWWTPGTGTNKTKVFGSVDLTEYGLSTEDKVAFQIIYEVQNMTAGSFYGQGSVNGVWSGDTHFNNPWTNVIEKVIANWNGVAEKSYIWTVSEKAVTTGSIKFELGMRVDNANAEAQIRWKCLKVELGTIPTAWSPAPEDLESGINNAQSTADNAKSVADGAASSVSTAHSMIQQLSDAIANLVTDANGTSLMTQTSTGWTFNMSSINSNLNTLQEEIDRVDGEQGDTNDALEKLQGLVEGIEKKTAYITMSTDDNGDPCIELGKADNPFKVRITNTAIDFLEGSTKIAYVNNNTFYTEKMIVKNELQIGNGPGFVWRTRANGNMGLVYISG